MRASFVRCLEALLAQGSYVAIATHDEQLIAESLRLVREHGLGPEQYEFQMLLGVTPERGDELVRDGHRLRIYVPSGRTGTSTRCGASRRTRGSRATSPSDVLRRLRPPAERR